MSEVPFVGRATQLRLLTERLAEVRDGQARTVLFGGDAGVGKSRLLSTFAATARQDGALVLAGSCEEHFGDPMPYGPLLEVLETFGRVYGGGGPAYQRLVDFFELGGDSMTSPQQVFLAVRRLLDEAGEDAPVVLIVEDLHWADASTLDLVRHLAQAAPDQRRLLLVGSYRFGNLSHDEPLSQLLAGAAFRRRTERLEVPPFTLPELREFLTADHGRVDAALVARCFEWSDGIPFHAEQLMAAGALDDPEDVQLPADTRSVVLARLSGLSGDALRVLRVAAVAGRAMSRRLLRRVSELSPDALRDAVQECFDRQMLVTGRDDEEVYRFRHALLREAVYQTTVRDTRVDLHIAMAEALIADPGLSISEGSAAAELAVHWYQAGSWPQALAAAVQAGEIAVRTLAFRSAEAQFARALRLWSRVSEPERLAGTSKVQLLLGAAEAARWSGTVDRALEHIDRAIAEPGHDRPGELRERRANYLWEGGRRAEATAVFTEAAELLKDRPSSAVKARVWAGIALSDLHAGHYADGRAKAETALAMAVEVGARAEEGRALNVYGLALGMLGNPEGETRLRQAVDIARAEKNIEDLLRAYGNLGLVLENAGRLREAAETNMAGFEEARQLDLATTIQAMILANNASAALVPLGEWADAERIIAEVLLDRSPAESLYPRLTLAEVKVARGDYPQARELLASIEDADHGGDPRFLGPLHTIRALLALGEGDLTRAGDEVRRGVAVVRGENSLELLRLCAVGLRCAADRAETGDRQTAMAIGDLLAREGWDARPAEPSEETTQLTLLCRAERQRLQRADTPAVWGEVATGWARLDHPYEAAYARWRQAAAYARTDAEAARGPAREAHLAAKALGAEPLRAAVARLADRIGLSTQPEPVRLPYELTPAEFETLRYLCEGNDTTRIADARGVAKRTVETLLRRVYRKMNVHSQREAVTQAFKDGVFR